ncbi:MAG: glycosyltransferase family 4 protein [Candidatus Delongbacteria bacterium]|nr:glycosyltransferase family 4 protein [Candidatus Delongbacteria bacterium]
MRIGVIVGQRAVMSGGAIQAVQLCEELQQRGHAVCLVFDRPDHPVAAAAQAEVAARIPLLAVEMRSLPTFATLRQVRRWLRQHQVEVIYAIKGRGLSTALLATIGTGLPVIGQRGVNYPLDRFSALKYRHPRVRAIVAVSQATARVLVENAPSLSSKVRVVYQAYSERFLHPTDPGRLRRELDLEETIPLIGVVGNLLPRKGHFHLLRCLPAILREVPEAKLVFIGSGQLESVLPVGFSDRAAVIHTGFRDDVPELLPGLTLSINPAIEGEGLTGTTRESMVAGVPVVVSDVAGTGELIRDGENGFLVPAGDEQALTDRILRLLSDIALRRKFTDTARKDMLALCSPEQRVETMLELFTSALQDRPAVKVVNSVEER